MQQPFTMQAIYTLGQSSIEAKKSRKNNMSVVIAANILKEQEDRIYQAERRYKVLHRRVDKELNVKDNRQKQQEFLQAVQHSSQREKEIKIHNERKKMEQLQLRISINMRNKQRHKRMIENVRKTFNDANHQLYERIKRKEIENQQVIKTARISHLEDRISRRKRVKEEENIGRKSIKNFYQSQVSSYRKNKKDDVDYLLRISESRHQHLDKLVNRNSRVREGLSISSHSSNKSLKNPQKSTNGQNDSSLII